MDWPRISIVTPTYNYGHYLEQTMQSILNQNYPNLEYIVIDGGSTDNTREILERYDDQIAYWVSEPDNGFYDAINKGFAQATGDIMAWLNADDLYMANTLHFVAEIFQKFPDIDWISSNFPMLLIEDGPGTAAGYLKGFNRKAFMHAEYVASRNSSWFHQDSFIQQESTFWRRSLWEKAGAQLDVSYKVAGDFDLWARFYQFAELYGVETPLALFRVHGGQQSSQVGLYESECLRALSEHDGGPGGWLYSTLRGRLAPYILKRFWPLAARMGLMHRAYRLSYDFRKSDWVVRNTGAFF